MRAQGTPAAGRRRQGRPQRQARWPLQPGAAAHPLSACPAALPRPPQPVPGGAGRPRVVAHPGQVGRAGGRAAQPRRADPAGAVCWRSHASAIAEPHAVRPLRPCHRDWSQRPDTIFSPAQQWIANLTRADVREKGSGTEVMQCVGQGWWWAVGRQGPRGGMQGRGAGGEPASRRDETPARPHPHIGPCAACAACCRSYYLTGGLRYYNQARACPPCPPSAIAPSAAAAPGPAALLPALLPRPRCLNRQSPLQRSSHRLAPLPAPLPSRSWPNRTACGNSPSERPPAGAPAPVARSPARCAPRPRAA